MATAEYVEPSLRHLRNYVGGWTPAEGGLTRENVNPADRSDTIGLFPESQVWTSSRRWPRLPEPWAYGASRARYAGPGGPSPGAAGRAVHPGHRTGAGQAADGGQGGGPSGGGGNRLRGGRGPTARGGIVPCRERPHLGGHLPAVYRSGGPHHPVALPPGDPGLDDRPRPAAGVHGGPQALAPSRRSHRRSSSSSSTRPDFRTACSISCRGTPPLVRPSVPPAGRGCRFHRLPCGRRRRPPRRLTPPAAHPARSGGRQRRRRPGGRRPRPGRRGSAHGGVWAGSAAVHRPCRRRLPREEEFLARLVRQVSALRVWPGMDPRSKPGPVVDGDRMSVCLDSVAKARTTMSKVLRRPSHPGPARRLPCGAHRPRRGGPRRGAGSGGDRRSRAMCDRRGGVRRRRPHRQQGAARHINPGVHHLPGPCLPSACEAATLSVNRLGLDAYGHPSRVGTKASSYGLAERGPHVWDFYTEWRSASLSC